MDMEAPAASRRAERTCARAATVAGRSAARSWVSPTSAAIVVALVWFPVVRPRHRVPGAAD